jgi:hypothetical protein
MSAILGTIRASSWGDFFDCPQRWYWKNIEGVYSPSRGASVVGSAVHKGAEVFDRANLARTPVSIDAAVDAAADYVRNPVRDDGTPQAVEWGDDEERITQPVALDLSVKLTAKYCREVANDMEYSAVEVKCTRLDVSTDSGVVRMTGTIDRVRVYPNRTKGVADFKSGGKAVEGITSGTPRAVTRGHQLQLGAYTLMSEQELKEKLDGPATIIGFQTNSKLHIAEGVVERPKLPLVGTADKPGMIEMAATMLKSGLFPPNPKSMLCSKKWCPAYDLCIYHE